MSVSDPRFRAIQEDGYSTTALYGLIFVAFFRCLLFQTRLWSLPKALFAFASLLSTSIFVDL